MTEITLADIIRKYGLAAFSTLGALVGLSFVEKLTIVAAVIAFAASLGFAVVMAPIAVHYIAPPAAIRDHVIAAVAGLFGLVGFVICGAIHSTAQHVRAWLPEAVRRFIEKRAGG